MDASSGAWIKTEYIKSRYNPEKDGIGLHSAEGVEISLVTSGEGIHAFSDGYDECYPGDMYIVSDGVLHGYLPKTTEKHQKY